MFYFLATAAYAATKETTSFNTFELIFHSSFVVQLILLLLASFSFTSWAIMFAKWGVFKRSFRSTDKFLDIFWSGKSLDSIYSESKKFKTSSIAKLFQAGYIELQRILEKEKQNSPEGKVKDANSALLNLERSLKRASRNESIRLEKWLSFLATAGSTAPFIGLFGTVWGIMNAFQSIGMQGAANLATVAPGIAEALITTAVGLFCAIPAVMGYNFFVGKLKKMFFHMENFSGDFLNIVKRNFLT